MDNMGLLSGLHRGEMECIGLGAKAPDLWINVWGEIAKVRGERITIDVKHVMAHRTRGEKAKMKSTLRKDMGQPAKEGTDLDGGALATINQSRNSQARKDGGVRGVPVCANDGKVAGL